MRDKTKRRVHVERGLYQRPSDGKYEAGFVGSDGRWHILTLKAKTKTDARRERAELTVKQARGEAVAPSRINVRDVAEQWIESFAAEVAVGEKAARTEESYRYHLRVRIYPAFGTRQIQKLTTDMIAREIGTWRNSGLAASTIKGTVQTLGRVCAFAVRRGFISENPVKRLERSERPRLRKKQPRVLTHDEISGLLEVELGQMLHAVAVFSGPRQSEVLGLRWQDVDFDNGFLRIRNQLARARAGEPPKLVPLKTDAGRRDVVLLPQLARALREYKVASAHSRDQDFVFTVTGEPLRHRRVQDWFAAARTAAGLDVKFHDLRHTFASHLILDLRLDPVQVSKQMGHSSPAITMAIYAHLFDQARHADEIRDRMAKSAFGALLG